MSGVPNVNALFNVDWSSLNVKEWPSFAGLGVYNVKYYGAKGDGVTDDTAAIQAAITAANTAGGGIVWVPPGTYMLSPGANFYDLLLASNVILQGSGPAQSILSDATQGTGGVGASLLYGTNISNIGIRDIQLLGNATAVSNASSNHGAGFELISVDGFVIENVVISDTSGTGYFLGTNQTIGTAENGTVRTVRIFQHKAGAAIMRTMTNVSISDVKAVAGDDFAFGGGLNNSGGILNCSVHDIQVTHNDADAGAGNGYGFSLWTSTGANITNLTISDLIYSGKPNSAFGIYPGPGSITGVVISNAVIDVISSGTRPFQIIPGTGGSIDGLKFVNCIARHAADHGFFLDGTHVSFTATFISCLSENNGGSGYYLNGGGNGRFIGCHSRSNVGSGWFVNFGTTTAQIVGGAANANAYGVTTNASTCNALVDGCDLSANTTGAINNSGTGSTFRHCPGLNPVGHLAGAPGVPASGTPVTNQTGFDAMVVIAGGTFSSPVQIGGVSTGATDGAFLLPVGQSIILTYSVAPTWAWFGS